MKPVSLLTLLLLLSGCSNGSPTEPDGRVVTTDVYKSSSSAIAVARNEKITTSQRFAAVWSEIHRNQSPAPAIPQINFDSYDVLMAARGTTPDICYEIEIGSVIQTASNLSVQIVKIDPAPACAACPPATGAPVHLVRIRKPRTEAQFTATTRTKNC